MPYTFKDRCNILNIMEYLSTNDLGRAIAVYKFYDMSNSYNAAEFSFEEAQKQIGKEEKEKIKIDLDWIKKELGE